VSCQRRAGLVGRLACRPSGIGRLAARSGFYAGLGVGVGAPVAVATRLVLQRREQVRYRQFCRLAGQLQQAARLGYRALEPETPERQRVELMGQAKERVAAAAMSGMLKLPGRYQGPLVHLAGDILLALDEQHLLKPGNIGRLAQARRMLRSSQSLFLLQHRPVGWDKPLALGTAAGLAAAGAGWAIRRRRRAKNVNRYAATLGQFYRQDDFKQRFDFAAGLTLSARYGGRELAQADLKGTLGRGSTIRPLVKQGGEDDIYLAEGPAGHIHYTTNGNDSVRLVAVVPRRNKETVLAKKLEEKTRVL